MHKFLRKNSKVIIWVVVIAFIFGGTLLFTGLRFGEDKPEQNIPTIAKVNGEPVYQASYYRNLQSMSSYISALPVEYQISYRYQALEQAINQELLLQAAKDEKIKVKVRDRDIDNYVEEMAAQAGMTVDDVEDYFADQGMTQYQWRKEIKEGLQEQWTINALYDKIIGDVVIGDQEVIDEYETVDLRTIFIESKEDGSGMEKAKEALAELEGGTEFAQVVEKYSEGANKANGGQMNAIKRTANVSQELIEAAFSLNVDATSDIIETKDGYYIVKVAAKTVAEGEEYEAEKENIRQSLLSKEENRIRNEWFQKLVEDAEIVIEEDYFAGYKALIEKDYETAIAKLSKVVEDNPESAVVSYHLGRAYEDAGQTQKALDAYLKSVELDPEYWAWYFYAAHMYHTLGNQEQAILNLETASKKAGNDRLGHNQIKGLYQEMGLTAEVAAEQAIIDQIIAEEKAAQEAAQEAAEAEANQTGETESPADQNQ